VSQQYGWLERYHVRVLMLLLLVVMVLLSLVRVFFLALQQVLCMCNAVLRLNGGSQPLTLNAVQRATQLHVQEP